MKSVAFSYAPANGIDDAQAALRPDGIKLISGGQSLGPMLNLRLVRPSGLVDVSGVEALRQVVETETAVRIGAAITHAEIEDGLVPDPTGKWLRDAASRIAYRAVRNRGTVGGSLAHADPAADWVIVMTTLCTTALVHRAGVGEVRVPMEDFVTGPFQTVLEPQDVLVAVEVPKPGASAKWGYWKYTQQEGEFAKASAAILLDPDTDRRRIVVGALGRQPAVLTSPDALLSGELSPAQALAETLPDMATSGLRLHATALTKALEQVS